MPGNQSCALAQDLGANSGERLDVREMRVADANAPAIKSDFS